MADTKARSNSVKTARPVASKSSDTSNATACAVLSYFLIGIIWYFVDDNLKKERFAKFHVKQALILLAADVMLWVAFSLISMILGPFVFILMPISFILWICLLILFVLGIINAATGKENPLPVIGGYAEKLNF